MKLCHLHVFLLVILQQSVFAETAHYKFCVEKESNLAKAEQLASKLNSEFSEDNMQFTAVNAGSMHEVVNMMLNNECHIVELDAGKALGVSKDSRIAAKPLAQEGSGSYLTMAIARKDVLDEKGITNYCDVIKDGGLKACHTGFMKSAGWISPMAALHECAQRGNNTALKTTCSRFDSTGTDCHNEAFGNSCVPGMVNEEGETLTLPGQKICMACQDTADGDNGLCSDTTNSDYTGAAAGTLMGNCDISFVKTSTIECPEEGQGGFCKAKEEAACTATDTCDSKSVYAQNIDVTPNTFVKVPGYGSRVPAHLVMQKGMSEEHAEQLMGVLADAWQDVYENTLMYKFGTPIEDILGDFFVGNLQYVPYFYEYYGLIRPKAQTIQVPAKDDGLSDAVIGGIIAGSVVGLAIIACVALKFPELRAKFRGRQLVAGGADGQV